jgi:hypothetical protein
MRHWFLVISNGFYWFSIIFNISNECFWLFRISCTFHQFLTICNDLYWFGINIKNWFPLLRSIGNHRSQKTVCSPLCKRFYSQFLLDKYRLLSNTYQLFWKNISHEIQLEVLSLLSVCLKVENNHGNKETLWVREIRRHSLNHIT